MNAEGRSGLSLTVTCVDITEQICQHTRENMSRDSSVGIEKAYRLDRPGFDS
jgi:hypothetical protein